MQKEFQIISEFDQLKLSCLMIVPDSPIGIIQISHGMCEHKERYIDFMNTMAKHGYLCIIHDHRGHGKSIKNENDLGYFYEDGHKGIVEDLHQITLMIKQQYPKLPLYLFGHSMGSLVVRCYLQKYDQDIQGLFVCGSPSRNPLVNAGIMLAKLFMKVKNDHHRPYLLQRMAFESFQKGFEDIPNSWICSDLDVVENYNNDPLCRFVFTSQGFYTLFQLMKQTYLKYTACSTDLPIHFIAGSEDPCIVSTEKFHQAILHQRQVGYKQVTYYLFQGMRHEILNEKHKEKVYQHILEILKTWQK